MEEAYYPLEIVESSFEVKGSTFISYVIPINMFAKYELRTCIDETYINSKAIKKK